MSSYNSGKFNITINMPYSSGIYSQGSTGGFPPPIETGFLTQEDGFYILQEDGSKIIVTGE